MNRIRVVGLALLAVFAFSAVSVAVSSATEGPWWQVGGKRLAAGAEALLLASAKEKFVLKSSSPTKTTIVCTALTLPVGNEMKLIGLATGNGGISLEVLEYKECTVENNGSGCEVENKSIKTNLVLNLLGYANEGRTGNVLVLFQPETGKVFTTIKFTGSCTISTLAVLGSTIGLARVGEVPVPIGNTTESLHGEVAFPHAETIFIERNGTLRSVKAKLEAATFGATLSGVALLLVDLLGGPVNPWGVFS
jgi:hypothetical protein